ncbi:MAG: hypothetical protein V4524_01895 [Patescibacteria group bacterium]
MKDDGGSPLSPVLSEHIEQKALLKALEEADNTLKLARTSLSANAATHFAANNKVFTAQATTVMRTLCTDRHIREYINIFVEKEDKIEELHHFINPKGPNARAIVSIAQQFMVKKAAPEKFRMESVIGGPATPEVTQHLAVMFPLKEKNIDWEAIEVAFYEHRYLSNRNETTWDKHERTALVDPELTYALLCMQSTHTALRIIASAFDMESSGKK